MYRLAVMDSLVTALIAIVLLAQPALAYVDPSTGSYMIQLSMGFLFGFLFSIRTFLKRFNWRKVRGNDELC